MCKIKNMNKNNLPFSKRYGFAEIEETIQVNYLSESLRMELWNAYYLFVQLRIEESSDFLKNDYRWINKFSWIHFFKNAFDDFPDYDSQYSRFVRNFIEKENWYKIYEFFEFVLRNIENKNNQFNYLEFVNYINEKLSSNNSGYILNNNQFIPITNENELKEIEIVKNNTILYGLENIAKHLDSAILLISQKPKPDFRNSIKESISMVEVISRIIEPNENTLGKALNKLSKKEKINETLKLGFEKLYAYTNDKNGIRHALMENQNLSIEDARFFLISCSAFTNYLIEKAKKENLLIEKIS